MKEKTIADSSSYDITFCLAGVEAPKRHLVKDEAGETIEEIPKWLEIKPTGIVHFMSALLLTVYSLNACFLLYAANGMSFADDEKTQVKKKKLIKSYKSKQRFQRMDLVQKQKADAWRSFVSGKGNASFLNK